MAVELLTEIEIEVLEFLKKKIKYHEKRMEELTEQITKVDGRDASSAMAEKQTQQTKINGLLQHAGRVIICRVVDV